MDNKLHNLFESSVIESSEVPELALYMDQIITLIENSFASDRRNPQDKLLTKTMINNYSKDKLLQPIKGKKYSKEHVLMMLMIYHLKSAISIPDIKSFFDILCPKTAENGEYISENVRELYDKFIDIRRSTDDRLAEFIGDNCEDDTELFLTLVSLSSAASTAAQRLLDNKKAEDKQKDN